MPCSESSGAGAITCPSCGYHAGQAAAADLLYNEQLLRADRLQQELSATQDANKALSHELSQLRDLLAVANRRAEWAVQERDAWIELSDEVKASLAEIARMA